MKILNICGYTWAIGGPAKIIFDHAQVQLALGHEVTILTPVWDDDKIYPAPDGAKVVAVKRHWFAKYFPEFSIEAWHWLRQHGSSFDVIHVHGPFHFAGMMPFLQHTPVAKAITIHGLLDRWAIRHGYWKKWLVSALVQKRILRQADLIQINNTDEQQDVLNYLGYQHPNVVIIPNGMKVKDFEHLPAKGTFRKAYNLPENKQLILFLGRINIKKGLDLLLPAYCNLLAKRDDCLLILAGPDDGYLTETEAFIKENQLADKIVMTGMLTGDTKLAALADADMFVLPSYSEGFSIAVLEAMASGTPVLVSDRVGFGEVIRETQTGHIVELNPESVRMGLEKMLDNKAYRQQLQDNALNLVKSRYDIQIVAGNLVKEFQKISENML
jgi:glycosyltransferase involved in cell wall biosynthesis